MKIEYTKEARECIESAKKIMLAIQKTLGKRKEEWHVFTFPEDNKNPDPKEFRIIKTSKLGKKVFGVQPKLILMELSFEEKEICIKPTAISITEGQENEIVKQLDNLNFEISRRFI